MFGFRGFTRLGQPRFTTGQPNVESSDRPVMVLISQEDIYRKSKGSEPVLLLRKGCEVEAGDLPKFIKNGARPHQFRLKYPDEAAVLLEEPTDFDQIHQALEMVTNPITQSESLLRFQRSQKRVLILEPDARSFKRLMDCLFVSGFNLGLINPVGSPQGLAWTLEKHQPHILIVDLDLGKKQNGLELLLSLNRPSHLEQVILTLPERSQLNEAQQNVFYRLCEQKNIKILTKPVNRFALKALLNEPDPATP